jgi:hypothetical protein
MRVGSPPVLKFLFFSCLLLVGPWSEGAQKTAVLVQRKQDELLMPPYLREVDGGVLNVNFEQRVVDQREKRAVKPGEWLEYGDSFLMPTHLAALIQLNEHLQVAGGGNWQGQILDGNWNTSKTAYEMVIQRGWMKFWIKPGPFSDTIGIRTPHVGLSAKDAVFWLMTGKDRTELYVLSGKVRISGRDCETGSYCLVQKSAPGQLRVSSEWTVLKLEEQIAKRYSNLVKLSGRAGEEWSAGKSEKIFAGLREKGWNKTDRFYPDQSSKK